MIKIVKKTHWISLFIDRNADVYFDSFGIEHILPEVLNKIRDKSIAIYLEYNTMKSIMCGFYCIAFI